MLHSSFFTHVNPEIIQYVKRIIEQRRDKKDIILLPEPTLDEYLAMNTETPEYRDESDNNSESEAAYPKPTKISFKDIDKDPNQEKDECDDDYTDCIIDEELAKFKPNTISYLSLPDENYNQQVVKRPNQNVIYGSGASVLCKCGTYVLPKNKKRHDNSMKHKMFLYKNRE